METDNYKEVKILVAEDSPTQAERVRYILEKQNYKVFLAQDGRQAIDMIDAVQPNLVISDVVMPGMDGYELCKKLKTKNIPVILVTSLSSPEDIFRGLESGACHFIQKPFHEEFLIGRVEYILANDVLRRQSVSQFGIELFLSGKKYFLTAEKLQIIDLLFSVYESVVQKNAELEDANKKLEEAKALLAKQIAELHEISLFDELTGLRNRRGFFLMAEQQLKIAIRKGQLVLLIMIDVDELKNINDTYGHKEGDKMLKALAVILKKTFRETDIIARMGGDEFIVFAIEADKKNANDLELRLKDTIDNFNSQSDCSFKLQASVGKVCCEVKENSTLEELLDNADKAMYEKKRGKNGPERQPAN
ncbi:diguanylate cyclase [Candidatus Kuenenia sp.]|uniref:diguanylate cyclase n=1 Tax=Candidatus Kuenenia sp. TaxID=2499824 RepID=UPI00322046CC